MGRNKKPRCELCGSNVPLDFGETRCKICKRTCPACGRLIPYSGRGRGHHMCPKCSEGRFDQRLCPCGKPVSRSRVRYCSQACAAEAKRIGFGGRPQLGWAPNLHTIAKREGDHKKAAGILFAWLHRTAENETVRRSIELREDSVFTVSDERIYVARATGMGFYVNGDGMPKWVPVDDDDRLTAMDPEPMVYALFNGKMDTVFFVSPRYREKWKSESLFVPRYGGLADVLHCPSDSGKLMFLGI